MASESVAASGEQFKTSCYITYTYTYIYIYSIYRLVLASGTAAAVDATHTRGGVGWGGMLTFM